MQKGSAPASPATTLDLWAVEAEAMLNAGLELQRLAVGLPIDSPVRESLLADAKRWFTKSRTRGFSAA